MRKSFRGIFTAPFSHAIPLEKRLTGIFLVSGFVLAMTAFASNSCIGVPFWINSPSLLTAGLCVLTFVLSRNDNPWPVRIILFYITFLYFPFMFFVTGGTLSTMPMYFVMIVVFYVITFNGKFRVGVVATVIAEYIVLLVAGHLYPQYVIPYIDETSRVIDYGVSFVMTATFTTIVCAYAVDIYEHERRHVVELLNQLEAKNAELLTLTNNDSLTGIFNRRYFLEVLREEILTHRDNNLELCVLMMDLDHFKNINDTYGHSTGDEILKLFTVSVKECLRRHDVLARYGGEEFVILLPVCSPDNGVLIAERIRQDIETLRYRRDIRFTVSIGIACLEQGDTELALIDRADQNLYAAKKAGRNRVVLSKKTGESDEQAASNH